jgi:hypothetical protein
MKIFDANISGSLNVSGAARFFGDLQVDGTINATISGTTSNASALNTTGSARFATTGSNLFTANQTISGSIIPSVNNAYDLGDATHWWKDIYVSTGSIFIGGIKAISTNSDGTIQVGAQVVQTSASLASVGLPVPPTGSVGSSQSTIVGSQNITGSQSITGSLDVSGSLAVTGSLFINGTSYTAASSGTSGSSGSSGSNGSSGTSGSSGSNGSSGTAGTSGSSGSNGSSGTSGSSGSSGTAGTSGSSGSDGSSGTSGSSGSSGTAGTSGSSGTAGTSGSSGSSGTSGTSGSSGSDGSSGSSGSSGTAGTSGTSVSVTGTNNYIGKFNSTGATITLVDSSVVDNGTNVTVNSNLVVTGTTNIQGNTSVTGAFTVGSGSITSLGGDLFVSGNLQVLGSSTNVSLQSNTVAIGDNIILVNAYSPFQRYAGISGFDSGSADQSGSLLWDSTNNKWLTVNGSNSSSKIVGTTAATLGSETSLTSGTFPIASADNTITDSLLTYSGTTLQFNTDKFTVESVAGNTVVAGTLKVSGNGADAGTNTSTVTFKNSSDVFGEISATSSSVAVTSMLGYKTSDGTLTFTDTIDGGTF